MGRLSTGVIFVLVLLLSHSHGYIIGEDIASICHIQHSKTFCIIYILNKYYLYLLYYYEYIHNVTFFENMFFWTS